MNYEVTITISLESGESEERVARKFTSLFEFGTIKESSADGLQLLDDPCLLDVSVGPESGRVV